MVEYFSRYIECKQSDARLSRSLKYLKIRFPEVTSTQILLEKDMDLVTKEGIRICSAHRFLTELI